MKRRATRKKLPWGILLLFTALLFAIGAFSIPSDFEDPPASNQPTGEDWPVYLGDKGRTHYSTLDQINKSNVAQLEVAWIYDTGEEGEFQTNNLIIDGVLYTASPERNVIALNAATGEEIWKFDPRTEDDGNVGGRQRGVVYWENEDGGERRIFTAAGTWLYALDAETGRPIRSFGENGSIHLGKNMDLEGTHDVGLNTPGVIYEDLLIMGGNVSERGTPGAIRAFDVRTGERRWIFHTLPHPGEYGYHTWPPDAWKNVGGASDWSGQALDVERGIVYISTESAGPDFYGASRHGMNLFANSIVALDANTGRRLWHFQITHHDLLDKDLPAPPTLITVTHEGRKVDAVAQGTKHGLLFVFDRVTGEPLWPIKERPVPQSDLPGEETWPTQPFPTKPPPLMRQRYTEDDVSTISPEARAMTLDRLQRQGSYGPYPAPGLEETIMFPGFDGGFEWGGSAADPDGILYTNINEIPWSLQMIPTRREDGVPISQSERLYLSLCASCHGVDRSGNLAGGMPSLLDIEARRTHEEVMQIVEEGGGRMPSFGQVSEERRKAIVDFLFGIEPPPSDDHRATNPGQDPTEPYAFAGFRRWFDEEGYPAIKPPWGTLNAVDLNTGEIKWKVPLGEYPELAARGIPPTGTENYGGPVVTAGGLIFIAATADEMIHAFDKDTGEVLWEAKLPYGGFATPSTYMVDGKQYVVISAGGGKVNRPAGGSIVAFALPG